MQTEIRVLALLGSPRKNGNTEALLDAALAAAKEEGASTEKVWLRDRAITPCIECGSCSKTGRCVLRDEMTDLYPRIEEADRLIIASPIFFYSVSAWAKGAIDRFQPFWARKYLLQTPAGEGRERYGAFMSVGATKGKRLFEGAVLTAKYCLSDANFRYFGHLLIGSVEHPGDVEKQPEVLQKAADFGRALVTNPQTGIQYSNIAQV